MSNKLKLIIVFSLLCVSFLGYKTYTTIKYNNLVAVQKELPTLNTGITQLYRGEGYNNTNNLVLETKVKEYIKSYEKKLKGTESITYNLTDKYGDISYENMGSEPNFAPEDGIVTEEDYIKAKKEMQKIFEANAEKDSLIYNSKHGDNLINVKDIPYDNKGEYMLLYGTGYQLLKDYELPRVYSDIIESNDFLFLYSKQNTVVLDKYTRKTTYVYNSATGAKPLKIQVIYSDEGVLGLDVNEPWH